MTIFDNEEKCKPLLFDMKKAIQRKLFINFSNSSCKMKEKTAFIATNWHYIQGKPVTLS